MAVLRMSTEELSRVETLVQVDFFKILISPVTGHRKYISLRIVQFPEILLPPGQFQKHILRQIFGDVFGKNLRLILELQEKEELTRVEIKRKSIEDIKNEVPELKGFIEQTKARLL